MTEEELAKIESGWNSADRCDAEIERRLVNEVRRLMLVARSAEALTDEMVRAVGSIDPLAGIRVAVAFCALRTELEAIRPSPPLTPPAAQ